jgi:pyruvate dehydrogenase E2 component (dihydrolipoamide acetyltransferase)
MSIDVRMPKLSDSMESGVIIRWMKVPGDVVAKGEPLAEVETDKADVELEASANGVLREITVPEGQSAVVGAVIAVLAEAGEAAARQSAAPAARSGPPAPTAGDRIADVPPPPPVVTSVSARPPGSAALPPAVRASPLAWRMADAAGVDLATVRGSGPGGRVLKRDVELAARAATPPAPTGTAEGTVTPAPVAGARREEVSRMRLAIARRMSEAKRDIPHFYVTAEIDMTEAMHLRESIRRREAMPGLTVTHLLVRALAVALVRHPHVNASWLDGSIEEHADVNVGIAVAVDDGLVVPVLHRAQTLTLGEIASAATELTEKARHGRFGGDDLTGATFSLSNVGMLDVEELTAVINPPNAAILAVGAVKDRPIVRDGQLAVAKTLRATLSCDHRVLNGLEGGRFLVELKSILENPVTLLLE